MPRAFPWCSASSSLPPKPLGSSGGCAPPFLSAECLVRYDNFICVGSKITRPLAPSTGSGERDGSTIQPHWRRSILSQSPGPRTLPWVNSPRKKWASRSPRSSDSLVRPEGTARNPGTGQGISVGQRSNLCGARRSSHHLRLNLFASCFFALSSYVPRTDRCSISPTAQPSHSSQKSDQASTHVNPHFPHQIH